MSKEEMIKRILEIFDKYAELWKNQNKEAVITYHLSLL